MRGSVCLAALVWSILLLPLAVMAQDNTSESNWATRCISTARTSGGDCSMEQRLTVQETGQLFATVAVRVPAEPRTPELVLTIPLGLYLPAGIILEVDGAAFLKIPVRNCDGNGCYALTALSDANIATMKRGGSLNVSLLNLARQAVTFNVPLIGFSGAFDSIE